MALHMNTVSVRLSDCADDDGAREHDNKARKRQYIKHGAYESGCGQMDVQVSRNLVDGPDSESMMQNIIRRFC